MFIPEHQDRKIWYRRRSIACYHTSWSRRTGLSRLLPKRHAKVTPTSIGKVPQSKVLRVKMAILDAGSPFAEHRRVKSWGHTWKGEQKIAAQVQRMRRNYRDIDNNRRSDEPVEALNLPVCDACGLMYQELFLDYGKPLVPTGFLLYDSTVKKDIWELDTCPSETCPHAK